MRLSKRVEATDLLAKIRAAGIPIASLWYDDHEIGTYDADGLPIEIPQQHMGPILDLVDIYELPQIEEPKTLSEKVIESIDKGKSELNGLKVTTPDAIALKALFAETLDSLRKAHE